MGKININKPWHQESAERERQFTFDEQLRTVEFSGGNSLALDYRNGLIKVGMGSSSLIYRFAEIDWAVLRIDGETVVNTSVSSTLGRAAALGALTGGFGAIVGALSAKKTQSHNYKSIILALKLPAWHVEYTYALYRAGFFKGYSPTVAIEVGRRVCERITEARSAAPAPNEPIAESNLIASSGDQVAANISALAELYSKGLLSQEEFAAAKRKILG